MNVWIDCSRRNISSHTHIVESDDSSPPHKFQGPLVVLFVFYFDGVDEYEVDFAFKTFLQQRVETLDCGANSNIDFLFDARLATVDFFLLSSTST